MSEEKIGFNIKSANRCRAHSRNTGKPCGQPAMGTNGLCRLHGGKSLQGIAAPNYKHGRYSRTMPISLAEAYESAINDPEILNLTDEIAVTQARLNELLDRLDTGESMARWKSLQDAWKVTMQARRRRDSAAYAEGMEELGKLMNAGVADWMVWD